MFFTVRFFIRVACKNRRKETLLTVFIGMRLFLTVKNIFYMDFNSLKLEPRISSQIHFFWRLAFWTVNSTWPNLKYRPRRVSSASLTYNFCVQNYFKLLQFEIFCFLGLTNFWKRKPISMTSSIFGAVKNNKNCGFYLNQYGVTPGMESSIINFIVVRVVNF